MVRIFYSIMALTLLGSFYAYGATGTKGISDAEIAKALITINEGEIDAAKIAEDESQNKEVKDFAKMMINAHELNINETKDIAKKNGIDFNDSGLNKSLKAEAKRSNKELKKIEKTLFDKTYLDQQIRMHEKALNTLNGTLIPNAKDLDFKAHLEKTRSTVVAHLQHAKSLRTKIP